MNKSPFFNRPNELALYEPIEGSTMLELGGKVNSQAGWATYKSYFEAKGFKHVSIDWNGKYGALVRDLRTPIWPEFGENAWDYVTNFGTTEHVDDQAGVWENIHMLAKVGGVYVGHTPYHDGKSWWWHGDYYPTEGFFQSFASLNGWEVERLYVERDRPHQLLCCRMRKLKHEPFMMPPLQLIAKNVMRPRTWTPT